MSIIDTRTYKVEKEQKHDFEVRHCPQSYPPHSLILSYHSFLPLTSQFHIPPQILPFLGQRDHVES